ncbi:unnamed protein product [Clonostachys solani]|uniref:Uncharacterized protein n=1 Tax=Clonostachys solani TaxID=160281 RepID=A0A9P0ESZ8_9HYPO|nr:unnamed protein product [Clonostachys solani]
MASTWDQYAISPLEGAGECAETEKTERQVCAWMTAHERLGRDSPDPPQDLNATLEHRQDTPWV